MRKISALISLLCIVSMALVPFPVDDQAGVYNTFSGLYWCKPSACLHEIGHKLDDKAGWPSESIEFRRALKTFIMVEARQKEPDKFFHKIFDYPNFSNAEIYASLFKWSEGKQENMPPIFRPFYDWELAERLMK